MTLSFGWFRVVLVWGSKSDVWSVCITGHKITDRWFVYEDRWSVCKGPSLIFFEL